MPKSSSFLRVRFQELVDDAEEAPRNPLKNSREVSEAYENLAIGNIQNFGYSFNLMVIFLLMNSSILFRKLS